LIVGVLTRITGTDCPFTGPGSSSTSTTSAPFTCPNRRTHSWYTIQVICFVIERACASAICPKR